MRAVGRLILTYFLGTTASKWLTISGILLMLSSLYVVLYLPQTEHMLALAVPGLFAFFLGSSLMPMTVSRLTRSHAASLLPGARLKLLTSAVLTVLIVALPAGLMTPLAYVAGMSAQVRDLFKDPRLLGYTLNLALQTFSSACISAVFIYVILWFVTRERNLAGIAKGMLVLFALLFVGAGADREPGDRLITNVQLLAVVLLAIIATWPLLQRWRAKRQDASALAANARSRALAGNEIDLMLGNSRPWAFIGILLLPLLVPLRTGAMSAEFCLFYLAIASIVAGGSAERAPARSRALWLRSDGSRLSLFAVVERSAWRHNGSVMLALLAVLLGIGSYIRMPAVQMIAGLSLILVGTTLSTYIGLSLTRTARIGESLVAITVMMSLMVVAVMATSGRVNPWVEGGCLAALAGAAFVIRAVARHRWGHIDWAQCRGDTQRALRAG